MRLVLASASPRRRELLAGAGLTFEVRPADVDESIAPTTEPAAAALEIAARKWRATAAGLAPGEFGLVADTVVGLELAGGWQLFAKPDGPDHAAEMLRALSDTRHLVATGVAVGGSGVAMVSGVARTWVRMRAIEPAEIADYVASGEWRGKAGGYAIQESADRFVVDLEGDGMDNVVGLPVRLALSLLGEVGYTPARAALERHRSVGGGQGAR
ncbi:MAG: hypothetical protein GC161_18925 [Planctomycetaceae bacterium]|nr:hypothetical protein [Planctomycetaceae bacterium]